MFCRVFKMPAGPTPHQGSCLHSRPRGREWGGNCFEFPPLVSLQSKARMLRHGTKNHSGGHMAQKSTVPPFLGPGKARHGKETNSRVKGHSTPHVATASLQGPARGTQDTGPVPAANNGDTGQLCPREPVYPPHPGLETALAQLQ